MTALQMRGAGEIRIKLNVLADATARLAAKADNAATSLEERPESPTSKNEAIPADPPVSHRLPPDVSEGGSR